MSAINKNEAIVFLQILSQTKNIDDLKFTFQVFKDRDDATGNPQHFSGTLDECYPRLVEANQNGMGIFIMINEGDLQGRSKENVKSVRAVFVDLDGSPIEPVNNAAIKPSMIIQSSPGRFHAYWIVDKCELKDFPYIQRALASKFNGDSAVNDLPRVMRLPGFIHNKNAAFLTTIISNSEPDQRISLKDLLLKLRLKLSRKKATADVAIEDVQEMLDYLSPDCGYETWRNICFAIHSHFPNGDGFLVFDEWSSKGKSYSSEAVEKLWASCNSDNDGDKIGIGTLVKYARENGFTNEVQTRYESKKKKQKQYRDYIDFVLSIKKIKSIQREMLSDELIITKADGSFMPYNDLLDYIGSYAKDAGGFKVSNFRLHLVRYFHDELIPQLLVKIPEWDGVDRLKQICEVIKAKEFSKDELYELLLSWGVDIFRRLKDPTIQPITIILKGEQGVGKDTLINSLVGGLGKYLKELNLGQGIEAEKQLHTALVFRISEFDRTSKVHVGSLKHLLTTEKTNCRLSYDRRPQDRYVRASFVATCNVEDMLRDSTGNRRYWVIELDYGGFPTLDSTEGKRRFGKKPECNYPGMFNRPNFEDERLQILAQFKALASKGECLPSVTTLDKMSDIISKLTPHDPAEELIPLWDELVNDLLNSPTFGIQANEIKRRGWLTNSEIDRLDILKRITEAMGVPTNHVRNALKRGGLERRNGSSRGYAFTPRTQIIEAVDSNSESIFDQSEQEDS